MQWVKVSHSENWLWKKTDDSDSVCVVYLKVSQKTETGRWSTGTEQLLWLISVPLSLWTHPEGLKQSHLINLFLISDVWNMTNIPGMFKQTCETEIKWSQTEF